MKGGTPRRLAPMVLCLAVLAGAGCAPSRTVLTGPEGDQAARFFARLTEEAAFPLQATFSGIARPRGRDAMPFIAGVNASGPASEALGLYDPMGGAVAFLANDGRVLALTRGPMAEHAGLREDTRLLAGPVSLGRILAGAPGFPVSGGEAARGADGGWVLSDERQTLYTDPGRRFLAKAEYRVGDAEATVEYPERSSAAPPAGISVAVRGLEISLRRDP